MKKLRIYLLIMLMLLATLSGCKAEEKNQPAVASPEIRIGILPDVESIPLLIAELNGYFTDAGINVHLERFKSARDRDSALQSGLLDGMVTDMIAVFFANEGGFPIRMISQTDGTIFLLAEKNIPIENMTDINSSSVGLSTNTVMEYTLDAMLKQAKLPDSAVSKMAIPQIPARLEMLINQQVDLAILPEPWSGLAVQNGAKIIMTTQDLGHKAGVIAFNEQMIKSSPDEIKALFEAYNRAVEYLNENNPAEYIDLIVNQLGFPEETKSTIKLPVYNPAKMPNETTFYLVQTWLKDKDLISQDWHYEQITAQNILPE